jgi:hypothetical protein
VCDTLTRRVRHPAEPSHRRVEGVHAQKGNRSGASLCFPRACSSKWKSSRARAYRAADTCHPLSAVPGRRCRHANLHWS